MGALHPSQDMQSLPGGGRRRRSGRRRRMLRLVEPFAILSGLAALSLGTIKFVESGVATRAVAIDKQHELRMRERVKGTALDLSLAFEDDWVPEIDGGELFMDEPLPALADPMEPVADPMEPVSDPPTAPQVDPAEASAARALGATAGF